MHELTNIGQRGACHISQHLGHQASQSGRTHNAPAASPSQHRLLGALNGAGSRRGGPTRALPDLHAAHAVVDALSSGWAHALALAYEPLVLSCSSMNCGDQVYRSTLDPVLRMEQRGITPQGLALASLSLAYLLARPGVLTGALDVYILAPLQRLGSKLYGREDITIGRKIATGGFGTVYKADLMEPDSGQVREVIVKKATEFGEAEVWMNERIMRAAPQVAARFITAFADGDGRVGDPLWLVWQYEGSFTLAELMQKKEFPANMEALLFDRTLNIPAGPTRKAVVVRTAMQQLLEGLNACHGAGIVHRDIKPQNCIVAEADRRLKLIDFGAAADLRVGINYVPNQYLLDPRYAPPQQYIMSAQTPRAPPAPVAAFLSPVLWRLNSPDRFDMWSVGIALLQMAFPPLRSDNGLIAFNRAFSEQHGWDLAAWRRSQERRGGPGWVEGFAVLDALGGGGWDLALKLVQYQPEDRLSAAAALAHPWFEPSPIGALTSTVETLGRVAGKVTAADDGWLQRQLVRSATSGAGGLTEVQLRDELGANKTVREGGPGMPAGAPPLASATVAWWQQRRGAAEVRLKERRSKVAGGLRKAGRRAARTIKEGGQRLGLGDLLQRRLGGGR